MIVSPDRLNFKQTDFAGVMKLLSGHQFAPLVVIRASRLLD
jgi:hypothetical protein